MHKMRIISYFRVTEGRHMYVGYRRGKVHPGNEVGNGEWEVGPKKVHDGNTSIQCGVLKEMTVVVMSTKVGRVEDCRWKCGRSANEQPVLNRQWGSRPGIDMHVV